MTRKFRFKKSRLGSQDGLTMLEVLFGAIVMTVGFMGLIGLVATAIASNNRNKLDSTGTMLTQAVIEQVNSTIVGTGTAQLTDCEGTTFNIATAAGGASVSGGNIDFSQSQSSIVGNYYMNFAVCDANTTSHYDVRWNVQQITGETFLVTVGAKMRGTTNSGSKYFALPVTMRTYVSPQ